MSFIGKVSELESSIDRFAFARGMLDMREIPHCLSWDGFFAAISQLPTPEAKVDAADDLGDLAWELLTHADFWMDDDAPTQKNLEVWEEIRAGYRIKWDAAIERLTPRCQVPAALVRNVVENARRQVSKKATAKRINGAATSN